MDVALRPWAEGDLPLLERLLGDPAMTVHLGGPETPEQLRSRHARYLKPEPGQGAMYVIEADGAATGSIGYWPHAWQGETVWETGWSVLPEFQGRGLATRATALIAALARAEGTHRSLHAFPSVDNGPSNAICRKAGFTLQGAAAFEYPAGHWMRCNDWRLELFGLA